MSKDNLSRQQQLFIEDVANLLTPWGMPQTSARLYGCLLLNAEPISLDQIACDLEVSKSSASVAARLLEKYGMARRQGTRGSKRVLYSAPDNYAGLLGEQAALLGRMSALLANGMDSVATGKHATERMAAMAAFYQAMQAAITAALAQLTAGVERSPSRIKES